MNKRIVNLIFILAVAILLTQAIGVTQAKAGTYPPGISYSSMLDGVKYFPKDGRIMLHHIRGVFFPGPDTQGWVIVKKDGGEDLYKMEFKVQQLKSPYYLIDFHKYQDLKNNKKVSITDIKLKEAGKYRLDFFIGGKKFYTFAFSLSNLGSSDPFAGEGRMFLEGPWRKWGYLFYNGANPDRILQWKIWLRNKSIEKSKRVSIDIRITKGGKLIAKSRDNTSYNLHQNWVRYAFDMVHKNGSIFRAKELLAKDGDYTLKMKVDGKSYGTWKFNVAGGKLSYTGRTVRGKADSLTFVEGGRDAWWYEKQ